MKDVNEVPELKGVKMLVWDSNEKDAVEREVVGKISTSDFPYLVLDANTNWNEYMHAKPLPQPWEVAPEGYRLVTEEEREKYTKVGVPYDCILIGAPDEWEGESLIGCFPDWNQGYAYAVPLDYVFEPETIEVTMAELEAKYGKKVKVVREYTNSEENK